MLASEKGVVLVTVVVLSAVVLAVMTALLYMILNQTKISGMQKKYKTALEAARGGTDIIYDLINLRGDPTNQANYLGSLNSSGLTASLPANAGCIGGGYTGFVVKLLTDTGTWSTGCDKSMSIDQNDPATYDLNLQLGSTAARYAVYAKITSTTAGNSGSGPTFITDGTVNSNMAAISSGNPYLYAIEVLALNSSNPQERARLSILYQY